MFHSAPVITLFFFSTLGSDASSLPSLASSQSTWGTLRQSLKSLSVEFAVLSDKAAQQVRPSFVHPHHLLSKSRHRVVNVVVLMSSGPTGRGRCCGKTESFPGFAAVVQSESDKPFEFSRVHLQGSTTSHDRWSCFAVCMFSRRRPNVTVSGLESFLFMLLSTSTPQHFRGKYCAL